MQISQIGEFGLIRRMRRILGNGSDEIVLGIGDDAAVVRSKPESFLVITTDALVEGVHFDLDTTSFEHLGWKSLAVNLSDVASVGGMPAYAVISLALPEKWHVENVESFYRGLKRCGRTYHCAVVGGDTTRSCGKGFISVSVVGYVHEKSIVNRSGAAEGDLLCVTGDLGSARVGFEALKTNADRKLYKKSIRHFLEPVPRVTEAKEIITQYPVSSMIDISDGLASDVRQLCDASHLGCVLWEDALPIPSEVRKWTKNCNASAVHFALTSGEEYELLFTLPRNQNVGQGIQKQGKAYPRIAVIGEMVHRQHNVRIRRGNKTEMLTDGGWDHFKK